ncbi:MAG: zf-HC2 domain-containing protein [Candidatus Scalindua sp.]|nr:zf-HC2 domain-containing protein [Candidatus Scalindua sp.]
MTCNEAKEKLYDYVDNEIGRDNYLQIRHHLDGCRKCSEEFKFEQSLKKLIQDRSHKYTISKTIKESIIERLSQMREAREGGIGRERGKSNEDRGLRIIRLFAKRPAYAMAAAFIPFIVSGLAVYFAFFRSTPHSPIIREIAECHDQHVHGNAAFGLVSSDQNELIRNFNKSRDFNFAVAASDSNDHETRFLGCRDCYLGGRKSVHVELERKLDRKFSLEIIDGSGMNIKNLNQEFVDGRVYYFGTHKGYNVVLWREGDTVYSLTSEARKNELIRVAREGIRMRRGITPQTFLPVRD